MYPQPFVFPISDHNIVSTSVKRIVHFARNRRLRTLVEQRIDRGRWMTDPWVRQEVATATERHQGIDLPGDSSVDGVDVAFAATIIMRTAELGMPRQERKRPGRGWGGDA